MGNMYLVCGMSGSGKTTLAKKLSKANGIDRLDVDEMYAEINGDECNRSNKFRVWISYFERIHEYAIGGKDVILDTNALTYAQRNQFIEWFPEFDEHHIIYVVADPELRKRNNKSRKRQVPSEVLEAMAAREQIPTPNLDKEWDTICYVFNENNSRWMPCYDIKGYNTMRGFGFHDS